MSKLTRRVYGYGIVGKSGAPWSNLPCASTDHSVMRETVAHLNADDDDFNTGSVDTPYRVVRLFYMNRGKR